MDSSRALALLDEVLRARPHAEGHAFSAATEAVVAMRDAMIDAGAGRARLDRVNAVISVLMAGHFPLGAVPWGEIEGVRGWLAELVEPPSR